MLYAGLILTADGPKVIEFNARFGDPETQIILPRLTSDFAQNITDILDGKEPNITWTDKGVTLGVVVASNTCLVGRPNAGKSTLTNALEDIEEIKGVLKEIWRL